MAWFEDRMPIHYFALADASRLRAIGWLEPGHSFPIGEVTHQEFASIFELAVEPWQPSRFLGFHDCGFCRFSEGPSSMVFGARRVEVGCNNLFVPAGDVVFVAPSMILHYVDAHGYRPPDEFLEAIEQCPRMGSREYLDALITAGGEGVLSRRR